MDEANDRSLHGIRPRSIELLHDDVLHATAGATEHAAQTKQRPLPGLEIANSNPGGVAAHLRKATPCRTRRQAKHRRSRSVGEKGGRRGRGNGLTRSSHQPSGTTNGEKRQVSSMDGAGTHWAASIS